MTPKKIKIVYWHLTKYKDLNFEHNQEIPYSVEKRDEIITYILGCGYSVMLRQFEDELMIAIDKGRFG
jgi:hypothetical protein